MTYTASLEQILKFQNNTFYKVLQLKILNDSGRFSHQSEVIRIEVTDGVNTVSAFSYSLSGNLKELLAIFTTDAFSPFSSSATIRFGTNDLSMIEINDFDPTTSVALPTYSTPPTYTEVTTYWLNNH